MTISVARNCQPHVTTPNLIQRSKLFLELPTRSYTFHTLLRLACRILVRHNKAFKPHTPLSILNYRGSISLLWPTTQAVLCNIATFAHCHKLEVMNERFYRYSNVGLRFVVLVLGSMLVLGYAYTTTHTQRKDSNCYKLQLRQTLEMYENLFLKKQREDICGPIWGTSTNKFGN